MGNQEERGAWLLEGLGASQILSKGRQEGTSLLDTALNPLLDWDTSVEWVAPPWSCHGFGVIQCPLLISRASLIPRARDIPREGTSFLQHQGETHSFLPKCTSRFPHKPAERDLTNHPVFPGKSMRDSQGQHFPHHASQRCLPTLFAHAASLGWEAWALPGKPSPCPSRPRSPRPRVAGMVRLQGLGAAPTGRVDICNQHAGSGKGRAARPGGKLTLTLSLIKQNNQAASWSGDVAAAGGAGLGAVWERHPPPPRRDEPRSRPEPRRGPGGRGWLGPPAFPQTLPSVAGKHCLPSPFFPSLCKKIHGALHGEEGPPVSLPWREVGGLPGEVRRRREAGGSPGGGFR